MQHLDGKAVIVTGASRGIGAAAARAFVAEGARVALLGRSREQVADLAGELGAAALAIPCDVSRDWEMTAAVDATLQAFGRLDVLVNNAGVIAPIARIEDAEPDAWGKAIDINLKGVFHGLHAALPVMYAAGGGTVITLSSGAASRPLEAWSAYSAAKAGAAMLTRAADLEGRGRGLRAFGLSPGTVDTDMQGEIRDSGIGAVSRLERSDHIPPDWVARALVWLCTPEADDLIGTEVRLRDETIRRRAGLVA